MAEELVEGTVKKESVFAELYDKYNKYDKYDEKS
jgi:hypothetical protein